MTATDSTTARSGRMRVARSRGAVSGFLLVLLGLWGALIPFVGPYFDLTYTPDAPGRGRGVASGWRCSPASPRSSAG